MLTLDSRVVANAQILATTVGEQVILFDVNGGKYFSFEASARDIWNAVAEPRRIGDVCDDLLLRYAAEPPCIEQSSLRFLQTLLDRGLITLAA